jgi:integrase
MKQLKLPTKKHKGMVIYCSKCKKNFSWTKKMVDDKQAEPLCGETTNRLSSCKFKEKQRYKAKVHIPGTLKSEVTRILKSINYDQAIIEAVEFRAEFNRKLQDHTSYSKRNRKTKRTYLFDAQIRYLDFLDNIDVPDHKQKTRSSEYIKTQAKSLEYFNEALRVREINKNILPIDRVENTHVGYFHTYLNDSGFKNRTYNKHMGNVKAFYKWAIKNYSLNLVDNPFDDVQSKTTVYKKETITSKEFEALLAQITSENGKEQRNTKNGIKKKNYYTFYFKDALELALHTGGRREEIAIMKWNMIKQIDGKPSYIEVSNLKVERIQGEGGKEVVPKIIPVTMGLFELLQRLGYDKKKGTDDFLICPDRKKTSTNTIIIRLTKGFTFFYKQLNTGRELQFKCLRKTYLTYLDMVMKGDAKSLSSHSNDQVLQKHYIDKRVISKAVQEVRIFG